MSDENVEREALYTLRDRWERIVASAKDGTAHVAIEVAGTYDPFACAINTLLARASRPREAAVAPEALDKALAKAAHDVWAHAHPNGVCGQDVATPYIAALGVALGYGTCYPPAPPLAPEACPVAEKPLAWTAFSESSSWTGVWCKTREGAQERVDEFKRRWPKTGPYRVVPLYATPASAAGREGEVEEARRAFYEAARGMFTHGSAWGGTHWTIARDAYRALLAAEAEGGGEVPHG